MARRNDPVIIQLPGPRIRQEEGLAFEQLVQQNLNSGNPRIVLDMSHVEWMDSHFLGILVGMERRASEAGGRLVLCNVADGVVRILRLMRLEEFFTLKDSIAEATKEFNG